MIEIAGQAEVGPCSPFFIVADVVQSLAFYSEKLGFECRYRDTESDLFFAICGRGPAQIFLKSVGDVGPLPNSFRHADARWDAFIYTPNPKELAEEFAARGVEFHQPLKASSDGLRGFEIADPDGYICYFGRPK